MTGVRTSAGDVEAEVVVNCAGQWAKAVGLLAGVTVPLHSAEHFYVVTEAIDGVRPDLPILRDPDGYTYFKEEVGGLVVGGFEPEAKPWVAPDQIPYPFEFQLLDEDWEHFSVLMESAMLRIPALRDTGVRKFYNGPGELHAGQPVHPGCGACGRWLLRRGGLQLGRHRVGGRGRSGAGRVDRERVADVRPDGRRHPPLRAVQRQQQLAARPRRRGARPALRDPVAQPRDADGSPVPSVAAACRPGRSNANFGSKMGWERPNFFAPPGVDPAIEYTWGKPNWLPWVSAEALNTRSAVTVFDQTSFSKYLVVGPDAERALQWLCTADVAVPPGRTVYTGMLNARGTYESDVTVTRVSPTSYWVVSSAATTERDQDHMRRNLPVDCNVTVVDLTSSLSVLGVMGPASRALLSRLSSASLADFPFGTSREIDLGHATVRATRITYVGELGWELYVPTEFAVGVHEDLLASGADLGVMNGGYYAIDSLRLEKGYRAFGRELTPDYTPVDAGLLFACKLRTDIDFLGRAAVVAARAAGARRKLVSFALDDPAVMMWGGELVLRDGVPAGQVTSAAWGATVGACVGLAYLWDPSGGPVDAEWVRGATYEVNVGGELVPISVSLRPLVDPEGLRIKA